MNYSYVCEPCDAEVVLTEFQKVGHSPSSVCPLCDGRLVRMVSSPNIVPGWQGGFAVATNSFVNSERQFKSELSRKSDEMSERTGANHKFVPVDLREGAALGVTEEGLDATRKRRRDSGDDLPTRRIIA